MAKLSHDETGFLDAALLNARTEMSAHLREAIGSSVFRILWQGDDVLAPVTTMRLAGAVPGEPGENTEATLSLVLGGAVAALDASVTHGRHLTGAERPAPDVIQDCIEEALCKYGAAFDAECNARPHLADYSNACNLIANSLYSHSLPARLRADHSPMGDIDTYIAEAQNHVVTEFVDGHIKANAGRSADDDPLVPVLAEMLRVLRGSFDRTFTDMVYLTWRSDRVLELSGVRRVDPVVSTDPATTAGDAPGP